MDGWIEGHLLSQNTFPVIFLKIAIQYIKVSNQIPMGCGQLILRTESP